MCYFSCSLWVRYWKVAWIGGSGSWSPVWLQLTSVGAALICRLNEDQRIYFHLGHIVGKLVLAVGQEPVFLPKTMSASTQYGGWLPLSKQPEEQGGEVGERGREMRESHLAVRGPAEEVLSITFLASCGSRNLHVSPDSGEGSKDLIFQQRTVSITW